MAELAELVVELREANVLTGLGEDVAFKEATGKIVSKLPDKSVLNEMFNNIKNDVTVNDSRLVANDIDISKALDVALKEGDLEELFKAGNIDLGTNTSEISDVFKIETRDIPERLEFEERAKIEADRTSLNEDVINHLEEIDKDISNLEKNQLVLETNPETKNVVDWFDRVRKTVKYIVVGGVIVFLGVSLAQFISNYVENMSGAFLVESVNGNKQYQKIKGYSCKHPTGAKIPHPYNKEIIAYLKGTVICSQTNEYDNCAGWATMGAESRLGHLKVDFSKLGRNKFLECREATVFDSLWHLGNKLEENIVDLLKHGIKEIESGFWELIKPFAPLIALVGGGIAGALSFLAVQKKSNAWKISVPLIAFIAIGVLIYFIITKWITFEPKQNTYDEPVYIVYSIKRQKTYT